MSKVLSEFEASIHPGNAGREVKRTPIRDFWRKLKRQRMAMIGGCFVLFLMILSFIGPFVAPFPVDQPHYDNTLTGPSWEHAAGTDEFGRDILSRIIVGTKYSLWVGISSVLIGALGGTFLGLISGYYGGKLDAFIMRLCDVAFAFPGVLIAIGIIAILGPGLLNVVIAIAIYTVPVFARLVRGSTLSIKSMMYVEAARSVGASNARIMWKHIFPGTLSSVIVYFSLRISSAILTAAALSFLGLGIQPPTPEWGAMLSPGRNYLTTAPHVAFFPGMAIFLTVLAFNMLGDGIRDTLDPKIKDV